MKMWRPPLKFYDERDILGREPVLARTANRRAIGVMNEFAHLATHHHAAGEVDLVTLAFHLARTPVGPLFTTHVSPDRALTALTHAS